MRKLMMGLGLAALIGCGSGCGSGAGTGEVSGAIGAACTDGSQCGGGLFCETIFPGGSCTMVCDDDGDCGAGNWCMPNARGESECVMSCQVTACKTAPVCRAGYVCGGVDSDRPYCQPPPGDAGAAARD